MDLPQHRARDVLAGLSVAGLLLPEAIAYAGIANLPTLSGLLGACIGPLIYALFGSSRFGIVASTSSPVRHSAHPHQRLGRAVRHPDPTHPVRCW